MSDLFFLQLWKKNAEIFFAAVEKIAEIFFAVCGRPGLEASTVPLKEVMIKDVRAEVRAQ